MTSFAIASIPFIAADSLFINWSLIMKLSTNVESTSTTTSDATIAPKRLVLKRETLCVLSTRTHVVGGADPGKAPRNSPTTVGS